MKVIVLLGAAVLACALTPLPVWSQSNAPAPAADSVQERLKAVEESLGFIEQKLAKEINDLIWFRRLDDIAEVDKVRYTGPPPRVTNNPTAQGAGNEIIVAAYTFIPKNIRLAGRFRCWSWFTAGCMAE